ncbi:PP2C family protein-serine/threonine phosphatase [Occallatibacter riparius]|uniref:SpoIIE family protein phosphatase n=1 Tax=Occallatibacter riparius TaxID=1002689 RepID=A0A9J7BQB3_9BACT|nr:SpoIIE family protein phosphatase [Occallatibacter riparius]UWZ85068.1 SpoIIE family protein phosphatase [Occallatibacter riparius]
MRTLRLPNHSPWKNVPPRNIVIFLLAVFFVFASLGFVTDVMNMGRQPLGRFWLSVLLSGLFAVGYATGGIALRQKFWMAVLPLFAAQFLIMALLNKQMPDSRQPTQYGPAETQRLHARLALDGNGVVVCVILGYIGFLTVSISEGRRHARLRGEKAALDSEMAAAREIQRAMVPEELPPTPGYELECVYRPAAQVGGDFFQVIPLRSGSSLVIVGDVSGKGLSAAMIVSMVVGALNTITSFTEDPAAILAELNRRVWGRAQGGFVTCLVVRLDAEGQLTVANAGHLPPYRNGVEIAMAGSLPLGVNATASYEQVHISLRRGENLFLLTDGVVEAQNEAAELLGFSRVEKLLRDGITAADLAGAAQHHGQADDITVVSLQCTAAARVVA